MYSIRLHKRVFKYLKNPKQYPAKIHRQITLKIFMLQFDPYPQDSKKVGIGIRVDIGEYRILYKVDEENKLVKVEAIGPRNDDQIYKMARKLGWF